MAVEIKEVVIRAVINADKDSSGDEKRPVHPDNTNAIVQACVNEVMRIIKQSKQR